MADAISVRVPALKRLISERDEAIRKQQEASQQQSQIATYSIGQADFIERLRHREQILLRRLERYPTSCTTPYVRVACTRDRLLLFLHLAKTGGVTLSEIILRNLREDEFLVVDDTQKTRSALGSWSPLTVQRALSDLTEDRLLRLRAVWGHFGEGVQQILPKPVSVVTMLRDPIERIVSAFYYATGGSLVGVDGRVITLSDYVDRKQHYDLGLDNYMTRVLSGDPVFDPFDLSATTASHPLVTESVYLAAQRNLDGYMLAGLLDQFDETVVLLALDLGWSLSDVVYRIRNATVSRPPVSILAPSVRDKIAEWNRFDVALVAHARALLRHRIESCSDLFAHDLAVFRKLNSLFQSGREMAELRRMELKLCP